MHELMPPEEYTKLAKDLKKVNRLIKYLAGYPQTPVEHQNRMLNNIAELTKEFNTNNLDELNKLKADYTERINVLTQNLRETKLTALERISKWYVRPLINHFDSDKKVSTLANASEGAVGLRHKLQFFFNGSDPLVNSQNASVTKELHNYFQFKAKGKGTVASSQLEESFYSLFEFSSENPWLETSLGQLAVPCIHYNVPTFDTKLKAGEHSVLVTGLCPLSTIANEIGLITPEGRIIRPELAFEGLEVEVVEKVENLENIDNLLWPHKPILSDYIALRTIFELYSKYSDRSNVSLLIWYPNHEYFLDLTENIFSQYLSSGLITPQQISSGLRTLKKKYMQLIDWVLAEVGLDNDDTKDRIKIIEVDKGQYNELEKYRKRMDLSFFKYIYGSWVGTELRRRLYEQLIIKHCFPVFRGDNVLHLDTSYELWPELLAARVVENQALPGNFSFICSPSLPSISMKHMREYNAGFEDKLYLSEKPLEFQKQLAKLPKNYILHVAPLLMGEVPKMDKDEAWLIKEFKNKMKDLNASIQ